MSIFRSYHKILLGSIASVKSKINTRWSYKLSPTLITIERMRLESIMSPGVAQRVNAPTSYGLRHFPTHADPH